MNLKEAKRLQSGAIVRESWRTAKRSGLVIGKTHIIEEHMARSLCQKKSQRYDIVVHWFDGPRHAASFRSESNKNPEVLQNWEVMVVSHVRP